MTRSLAQPGAGGAGRLAAPHDSYLACVSAVDVDAMPFSPKGQLQAARAASASCRQWRASQRTVRPPVRCVLHERDTMARTRRTHASTRLGLGLGVALSRALPVFAPSSAGCGTVPPAAPGETAELSLNDAGNNNQRQFYMHVPVGYNASEPTAVVLAFHGWDNDGQDLVYPMTPQSDRSNFIVVGPNGLAENQYTSWNGGGTTQVPYPGPRGPTCDVSYPYTDYCYTSCAARDEGCHPCDWTTCNDDIAFVGTLLDWLEARLCLDLDKVYAVGFSNGATFTYAVSAALSTRIVAFVANSGTPHPGFEVAPERAQSVMDLHGTSDNTCPPDHTSPGPGGSPSGQPSGDGWYYLDVASTLTLWLDVLQAARTSAAGCGSLEPPVDPAASPPSYLTSADGERGLSCVRLDPGASCIGDDALNSTKIVRCSFEGGHEVRKRSCCPCQCVCVTFNVKLIILPRQARGGRAHLRNDRLRISQVHPSMPRVAWEFLSGEVDETCVDDDACLQVRKRLFCDAIYARNDRFNKTGSGRTQSETSTQRGRSLAASTGLGRFLPLRDQRIVLHRRVHERSVRLLPRGVRSVPGAAATAAAARTRLARRRLQRYSS
jgi:poly(3-hydroxybutyrate) depolymerase